jgi:hypothetical protein
MTSHVEKEAGRGHSLDSEAEGAGVFPPGMKVKGCSLAAQRD